MQLGQNVPLPPLPWYGLEGPQVAVDVTDGTQYNIGITNGTIDSTIVRLFRDRERGA